MRRALLVGIDDYEKAPLKGCIQDALQMQEVLSRHADGNLNFDCKCLLSSNQKITEDVVLEHIEELFNQKANVALLYFAGHGTVNNLGGYLVTQDASKYDQGVEMVKVLRAANGSPIGEIVILLDSCASGAFGNEPALKNERAVLREGVSVLTAARPEQPAEEINGSGIFTALVCEALRGGAADVIGQVTIASVYAFVDQLLGAWHQRPMFKSHVSHLVALRKCEPAVPLELLRKLPAYFPTPDFHYKVDPSFDPELEPSHPAHEEIFAHFRRYRDARLLVPVGEKFLYHVAMHSKACKLTDLGRFYRKLAKEGRI